MEKEEVKEVDLQIDPNLQAIINLHNTIREEIQSLMGIPASLMGSEWGRSGLDNKEGSKEVDKQGFGPSAP